MFGFLQGRPIVLILFGGRREVFVDDVSRYRNNGQWTDFYFAFDKARELVRDLSAGNGLPHDPVDRRHLRPEPGRLGGHGRARGEDLKWLVVEKTLEVIREMRMPLYVILVGDIPAGVDRARTGAVAGPDARHGARGERR